MATNLKPVFVIIIVLLAILLTNGCSANQVQGGQKAAINKNRQPFQLVSSDRLALRSLRKVVLAPIVIGPQAPNARQHLKVFQQHLNDSAIGRLGIESVSATDKNTIDAHLSQFKADAVFIVSINEFKEGKGSAIGSSDPAMVSMRYGLFASGGRVIWEASYFLKEQALTDDLLSIQERFDRNPTGAFRRGQAIVISSIELALGALENSRENSFLTTDLVQEMR